MGIWNGLVPPSLVRVNWATLNLNFYSNSQEWGALDPLETRCSEPRFRLSVGFSAWHFTWHQGDVLALFT